MNNDRPIVDLLIKETGRRRFAREVVWLLYFSWNYGYKDLSRHLISICSDVKIGNEEGWTLLHQAAYLDIDIDLIRMILTKGGDLRAKTTKLHHDYRGIEFPAGSTPEDIARIVGSKNLSKALMRPRYQPG